MVGQMSMLAGSGGFFLDILYQFVVIFIDLLHVTFFLAFLEN